MPDTGNRFVVGFRRHATRTPAIAALILVTHAAQTLTLHNYSFLLPESLLLALIAAGVGFSIGTIATLRPRILEPLIITDFLILYLVLRPEIRDAIGAGGQAIASSAGRGAGLAAIGCARNGDSLALLGASGTSCSDCGDKLSGHLCDKSLLFRAVWRSADHFGFFSLSA